MIRLFRITVAALPTLLLSACVSTSPVPELPDTIADQGIAVAKIYVPGNSNWTDTQIYLDKRLRSDALRGGYIAIALDPGEHNLEYLRRLSHTTAGYQSTTYHYRMLPINRKFSVESGKVTDLGLIIALTDIKDATKFLSVTVDNRAEVRRYLEANYPGLMASLKDREPQLAPHKYLDDKNLTTLRRQVAVREALGGKLKPGMDYIAGDAGTLAQIKYDAKGKISGIDILDTGTLAEILGPRQNGDTTAFLGTDGQLILIRKGRMEKSRIPAALYPAGFELIGPTSVVVADNRMNLYTSRDGGKTWNSYTAAALDKPSKDIGFARNEQGLFVYTPLTGRPGILVLAPNNGGAFATIPGPPYLTGVSSGAINRVTAQGDALYVDYQKSGSFHVRRGSPAEWTVRAKPDSGCGFVEFKDGAQQVYCSGTGYSSRDQGATWTRM